ncbi:integrase, catalytic region, zinc finger, CCHC-type containing protein [Tanacetum coccineum]|uniref:Integrase, catalytic region, zinc finger, CCHC-type containing protein n=1 Tax=Tanacetum coccineum TaxID=301880 RepID=A0ABQ4XKC9_9ASTR
MVIVLVHVQSMRRHLWHDSEDTHEIAEITRKRMLLKMQSPLYVENKSSDNHLYYSKGELLATFAPQRNLTPEQIFWSIDDNDRKKAETSVPKPISALTVYPPNTPVKLVPRVLPTKSVTEGERGFEQTKRCYLTEVIPFFKTLKEHFVGVQTALFKEVKVMEEIFDQMNNEVDKNTVDKQCAEIVKKNLLIENENLIANWLSNQLLYDVEKSRCLDLEAEMSKVHNESKHISKLEREYLNLQLKYQHLQESFDNKNSQTSQEAPDFNSFFKIKNLEHQIQEKDNVIRDLKVLVANVNDRSCVTYNAKDVTALIEQNDCVRVELEKVKQHYKELYDSIKITRAHTSEKTSTMLNEIESLKAQLRSKESCFTSDSVKPKVLAPGMYAIDVKPIPHPLKNNRSAHLNYISHLKESVETVREIVEEARVVKPLDNALNYACQYTKLSQELLEYVIGTCPKSFNKRDNKAPSTPVTRKKQVTFSDKPGTSSSNTQKHEVHQKVQQTNIHVIPSTGVNTSTEASGSKPRSNTKKNRILPAKRENKKKVEDHLRTNNSVNATPTVKIVLNKGKQIWKPKGKLSDNSLNKTKRVWKATGKLFADIGYQWRPTGKKFTLGKLNCGYQWRPTGNFFALGEMCPLTKLSMKCCSKHMTGNRSKLKNFVEKFIGTVRFGNDHFGAIMGYGDYVIGDSVISRVYYVEGLGHNLFSVGQFCDSDLEVAFRKHTCFVRDINGADLLKGSRSTNLYTISIDDMNESSQYALLSKASIKSWLWHRRLNHLNFGTINDLARKDLVRGLPRLKFEKDHLCSACQLGKSKKFSHKPKSENTNMGSKVLISRMKLQSFVINFLANTSWSQQNNQSTSTANGTEFVTQVMSEYIKQEVHRISTNENSSIMETIHDTFDLDASENASLLLATTVNAQVDPPGNTYVPKQLLKTHLLQVLHSSTSYIAFIQSDIKELQRPTLEDSQSLTMFFILHINLYWRTRRWTKDHPLDNIVGNPSRPVSTRKQLASDALWCCFHTKLSKVGPKNFKMAMIEDCCSSQAREIHDMIILKWMSKTSFLNGESSKRSSLSVSLKDLKTRINPTHAIAEEGSLWAKAGTKAWYDTLSKFQLCQIYKGCH